MNARTLPASACTTMEQVRANVDRIDAALVALLGERMTYMDAAARIKPVRSAVRDEARKAQVIAHVRQRASVAGLPDGLAPALWEILVETSINYEMLRFEALREE